MRRCLERVGQYLLLLMIGASYSIWLFGVKYTLTSNFYFKSDIFLIVLCTLILLFNIRKLTRYDYALIIFAFLLSLFYLVTADGKYGDSNNLCFTITNVLLLIECFKICPFSRLEKDILFLISLTSFILILVRLFIELPKVIKLEQLIQFDNSLQDLWVNVNTIGASILFSTIIIVILLQESTVGKTKYVIPIITFLGLLGTWVCQSQTSVIILLLFTILNYFIPKQIFRINKWWLIVLATFFVVTPFFLYYIANDTTQNYFTGREEIWRTFFETWMSDIKQLATGLGTFGFTRGSAVLTTHNSYLRVLSDYGILGYVILFGGIIYHINSRIQNTKRLTTYQIRGLLAFASILCYGYMEDSLIVTGWAPLIYLFVGMLLSNNNFHIEARATDEYIEHGESRMSRYH